MPGPRTKKILVSAMVTIASLVILEVVVGLQYAVQRFDVGIAVDPDLGWKPLGDFQKTTTKPGYGEVTLTTTPLGFRRFGDVKSEKYRILVIGDSYTAADTVSDGKAYFDKLGELLNAEVFAFGCNGYGTLQELMVLKRHWKSISPDLVVWQLCDNDFVNNSHELESRDLLQSNFMPRPYRIQGEDVVKYPARSGNWLLKQSQLARWAYRKLRARSRKQFDYSVPEHAALANEALALTGELLSEAKAEIGDVPLLVFCNRHGGLYAEAMADTGCEFTLVGEESIQQAVAEGKSVDARPRDLHWNEAGHEVVAVGLARTISGRQLLELDDSSAN